MVDRGQASAARPRDLADTPGAAATLGGRPRKGVKWNDGARERRERSDDDPPDDPTTTASTTTTTMTTTTTQSQMQRDAL
eukprot:6919067-Pyramimonas_sp.AAC.1